MQKHMDLVDNFWIKKMSKKLCVENPLLIQMPSSFN